MNAAISVSVFAWMFSVYGFTLSETILPLIVALGTGLSNSPTGQEVIVYSNRKVML